VPIVGKPSDQESSAEIARVATNAEAGGDAETAAYGQLLPSTTGYRRTNASAHKRQRDEDATEEAVKRAKTEEEGEVMTSLSDHLDTAGDCETSLQNSTCSGSEDSFGEGNMKSSSGGPGQTKAESISKNESDVRQKKKKQLELLRAKVALAKQKKSAMEKEARMKDTKGALERAKAKLRGAMQERAIANNRNLPPISGLSTSLIIANISETGPEDMVHFPSRSMDMDLGEKKLGELLRANGSVDGASGSLAARKSQLQKELLLLKEKLESKQSLKSTKAQETDASSDEKSDCDSKQVLTKQELERRRGEAQAQMDFSYWKHFVSKQEHILSSVTSHLQENSYSLKKCDSDLEKTEESIKTMNSEILDLEAREKIVANLISEASCSLLKKRNEQHSLQENQVPRSV
jgi:hypothetical protein